jgi:intermediate cleaving peptidase 55
MRARYLLCLHETGFNEPNALAIIGKCYICEDGRISKAYILVANDGSGDNHLFHLYVREKDPRAELWDGARSGTRAAIDVFNADEVKQHVVSPIYRGVTNISILER